MTIGLSRNNPWNLMGRHVQWVGLTVHQPDSGPLQFEDMIDGIRAGIRLCFTYEGRGWNTPLTFVHHFSPEGSGNPTTQYIANVCQWTGFEFDEVLNFHDVNIILPWAHAIFRQEQGPDNGVTDDQIQAGFALAESE